MTENSELVERVHGEVLFVYTDGHDHTVSDLYYHSRRIIALVEADVAARLLSEGAVDAAISAGDYDSGLGVMHHCGYDAVVAALRHIGIESEATSE